MLIPKSLKNQKLRIIGNFTLVDLALVIIYFFISFGIVYGLNRLGVIFQVVIGLAIFLILCCTLFYLPKQNAKGYEYVLRIFDFAGIKKKFRKDDVQSFFRYEKIENDCLVSRYSKTKKIYTKAFELQGMNIEFLTTEEADSKIRALQLALTNFDFDFSILKINQPVDLKNQINYYENIKSKLSTMSLNHQLTAKEFDDRWNGLTNTINFLNSENNDLDMDMGVKYIVFVYGKNSKECNNFINIALTKIANIGLNVNLLDIKQTLYYCLAVFDPYGTSLLSDREIQKYQNDLAPLFKLKNLRIRANKIETQNIDYHISMIYDFPTNPRKYWLNELLAFPNTCIIHSNFMDRARQKRVFERALVNSQSNLYSQRKMMDEKEMSQISDAIDEMSNQIVAGFDNIRETKIFFINYSRKKEHELEALQNDFSRFVKDVSCNLNDLDYLQAEALSCLNFNDNFVFNNKSYEIPNSAFAWGFPFTAHSLKDKTGMYLGNTLEGNLIFLDMFKMDHVRKNNNAFILGVSGSGKSYTTKKIISDMLIRGYKVIVLDPEREYKNLCKSFDGLWIDAGNGVNSKLNPLQILDSVISDDEEKNNFENENKILLNNHLMFLENWFLTLLPSLQTNQKSLNYIIRMIGKLYEEKFKKIKNIRLAKPIEFPTFTDLLNFLKNHPNHVYSEQNYDHQIHKEWIETIESDFVNGKFSELYNGYSQLRLNSNQFVVLDLYTLFDKGGTSVISNIIQAQLLILLNFCRREIVLHRQMNEHSTFKNKLFLVVDEAHTIIDRDNPVGLNFLVQTVKRIRKYDGGIMLISQNPKDFVGTPDIEAKTTSIINNTQYNFILNLKPDDINNVNIMYQSMGGLTNAERQYILDAKHGQGLLIINWLNRHLFKVNVEKYESKNF